MVHRASGGCPDQSWLRKEALNGARKKGSAEATVPAADWCTWLMSPGDLGSRNVRNFPAMVDFVPDVDAREESSSQCSGPLPQPARSGGLGNSPYLLAFGSNLSRIIRPCTDIILERLS